MAQRLSGEEGGRALYSLSLFLSLSPLASVLAPDGSGFKAREGTRQRRERRQIERDIAFHGLYRFLANMEDSCVKV